jgi:aspartate/methionine/tyrosine aminotransferase
LRGGLRTLPYSSRPPDPEDVVKHEEFRLERYMSRYEFSARHMLAGSDCESYSMAELVSWADEECRGLWEALRLGYTEAPGLPQLRREITGLYDTVAPDEVLEVVPEEGIFIAMNVLLARGDHVIATHPGYQTLYGIAEALGCDVTYWQPDEEQGWRFDPAFVRRELRPSTRLIVVNFPHNPTGCLPSAAEFEELLEIAAEAGAHVFSDEMYRGLERDPSTRLPAAVDLYDKAVSLSGLSKTYSLPGLRVGWLATRDRELAARLAAFKDFTTICASAPGEILALIGLRERERIVARNLRTIAANLDKLEAFAAERPSLVSLVRPRAGSVCFARLGAAEGALAFCRRLVEEAGVLLLPSSVFDYGDTHVRFGLGRASFGEGLQAFAAWLERRSA